LDLPRQFTIREASHRIHNPLTSEKLATLGRAVSPAAGIAAAQWLNTRRWLDANPDDELAGQMRAELTVAPAQHVRYQREYLGWGVFVLMER
jgi:hypothetical protein